MTRLLPSAAGRLVGIACLTAFALCRSVAGAQEARTVNCRLMWFDSAPPPQLIQLAAHGAEVAIELRNRALGDPVECLAEGESMNFVDAAKREPAAIARIPAGVRDALLVIIPGNAAADALPYQVMVVDGSPQSFPDGGAFVANLYRGDIRVRVGKERKRIEAGGSQAFALPDERDAFNMAPVSTEFRQTDTWRRVSESRLRFVPGLRYLILTYVDPASHRPRVATFPDVKPAEPPPEP